MERIGQWNVYKIEDVIKMQERGAKTITSDGRYGDRTMSASMAASSYRKPSEEMKPFYCPNCGGNSYRKVNGKTVCEYCDTEFIR